MHHVEAKEIVGGSTLELGERRWSPPMRHPARLTY
jgi:hypothetical protein